MSVTILRAESAPSASLPSNPEREWLDAAAAWLATSSPAEGEGADFREAAFDLAVALRNVMDAPGNVPEGALAAFLAAQERFFEEPAPDLAALELKLQRAFGEAGEMNTCETYGAACMADLAALRARDSVRRRGRGAWEAALADLELATIVRDRAERVFPELAPSDPLADFHNRRRDRAAGRLHAAQDAILALPAPNADGLLAKLEILAAREMLGDPETAAVSIADFRRLVGSDRP